MTCKTSAEVSYKTSCDHVRHTINDVCKRCQQLIIISSLIINTPLDLISVQGIQMSEESHEYCYCEQLQLINCALVNDAMRESYVI